MTGKGGKEDDCTWTASLDIAVTDSRRQILVDRLVHSSSNMEKMLLSVIQTTIVSFCPASSFRKLVLIGLMQLLHKLII